MDTYQVMFEDPSEKEIKQIVEMVGGTTLERVAVAMSRRAAEMEWELRCVRYAMTVVEVVR
jgi:hypothetical protein